MSSCPLQRSLGRIKYGTHYLNRHWRVCIFVHSASCNWPLHLSVTCGCWSVRIKVKTLINKKMGPPRPNEQMSREWEKLNFQHSDRSIIYPSKFSKFWTLSVPKYCDKYWIDPGAFLENAWSRDEAGHVTMLVTWRGWSRDEAALYYL